MAARQYAHKRFPERLAFTLNNPIRRKLSPPSQLISKLNIGPSDVVEDIEGHAGETETSLLWYLSDSYVDKNLIPTAKHEFSAKTSAEASDVFDTELSERLWPKAFSGNPSAASKEKGKVINELVVKAVVEVINAMRSGSLVSL